MCTAFRIKALADRSARTADNSNIATDLRGARLPGDTKTIAATGNFNIEATFDLSQVFVELAAKIGQATIVGGLEDYVPRNLDSIQSTSKTTAMHRAWEVAAGIMSGDRLRRGQPAAQGIRHRLGDNDVDELAN